MNKLNFTVINLGVKQCIRDLEVISKQGMEPHLTTYLFIKTFLAQAYNQFEMQKVKFPKLGTPKLPETAQYL